MNVSEALVRLPAYPFAVLVYRDGDGYPMSVSTDFTVRGQTISLTPPAGIEIPDGAHCQVVVSHIRPQPGSGYDERRYIELTGSLETAGETWTFAPRRARGWDEQTLPFFELCERAVPQAHRYLQRLSAEQGRTVVPRMSRGWKLFLATRAPFLTATLVPVFLGVAVAAYEHHFSLGLMVLTLLGAVAAHLGLNIANDIFDATSGADAGNFSPTMFSGGSRVIQYGLVNMRQMAMLTGVFYAVAVVVGLVLVVLTGPGLLWLGLAGLLISWFYTAPPLRLVHHGLGELAVALGFGPIMVLGAYFVQTGHYAWRPFILSLPVAFLVMLILYANEIPDRGPDARAGKRTLVVRLSPTAVVRGYVLFAALSYLVIVAGVLAGLIPWPALIALLTIPLALQAARGLAAHYDRPYEIMQYLQTNVVLHLATGTLLIVGVLAGHLHR